jgi:hypothetical protein
VITRKQMTAWYQNIMYFYKLKLTCPDFFEKKKKKLIFMEFIP